jgi:hypothetical protein
MAKFVLLRQMAKLWFRSIVSFKLSAQVFPLSDRHWKHDRGLCTSPRLGNIEDLHHLFSYTGSVWFGIWYQNLKKCVSRVNMTPC